MKIAIVGTLHQKIDSTHFRSMMEMILQHRMEHDISIESRYFAHLMNMGISMSGVRSMPMTTTMETDLLISIGGDGTFLKAARLIAGTDAHIMGVNAGRLGFLASIQPQEVKKVLEAILSGDFGSESRSMLEVVTHDEKGVEKVLGPVLNEVAIVRRDTASTISIYTHVDDEFVVTYQGDGILVSTPTGSTAYALSVGGPITHPASPTICICPIASHSLNIRPLVLADHTTVTVGVESRTGTFLLACDGKTTTLTTKTQVKIRKSDKKIKITHPRSYSYYATLQQKLLWGQDARSGIGLNEDGSLSEE